MVKLHTSANFLPSSCNLFYCLVTLVKKYKKVMNREIYQIKCWCRKENISSPLHKNISSKWLYPFINKWGILEWSVWATGKKKTLRNSKDCAVIHFLLNSYEQNITLTRVFVCKQVKILLFGKPLVVLIKPSSQTFMLCICPSSTVGFSLLAVFQHSLKICLQLFLSLVKYL